jgi:uncharacterized YceG family protein
MAEREDWFADTEGNLRPPDEGLKPPTDEFGRDDPAALERERRRREREARRQKSRKPKKSAEAAATGEPPAPRPSKRRPRLALPKRQKPAAPKRPAPARAAGDPANPDRVGRFGGHKHRRIYTRRRLFALALVLAAALGVWFLVAFFQPPPFDPGEGDGSVTVEIPEGASAGEIAEILDQAGVVSSAQLFEWRLKLAGKSDEIQASTYTLASGMSYGAAIDRLIAADTGGAVTVTIPEGLDRNQIAADILPEGVSSDEYLELTEAAPQGFDPTRYGAPKGTTSLEGFLFPATYELQEGQGAEALRDQQLLAFHQNIGRVNMSYAKKKNLTPYDVLIIASMIDKEVQVPSERPLVAAVIYNRLSRGEPLGIDATTRFETANYTEQIPQSDLEADTPYNTRLNAGLPPTPIGNPGLATLKAAAAPAKVNYRFFVVKPGTCGEHSFTASEQEFSRLQAEYQQALQAQGGSPTKCP